MRSPSKKPRRERDNATGQGATNSEEQQAVDRVARDFREAPEGWFPDPADDDSWEEFAEEVWAAAEAAGLDLAAISQAAEVRALEDIAWLQSPRASRRGLGEYLTRCRELLGLSREELAARIWDFTPKEMVDVETGIDSIYPLVDQREKAFADWVKIVGARLHRLIRLLRNCPLPPDWQTVPQSSPLAYHPASADDALQVVERYLPARAQAVIDRLQAAADQF